MIRALLSALHSTEKRVKVIRTGQSRIRYKRMFTGPSECTATVSIVYTAVLRNDQIPRWLTVSAADGHLSVRALTGGLGERKMDGQTDSMD